MAAKTQTLSPIGARRRLAGTGQDPEEVAAASLKRQELGARRPPRALPIPCDRPWDQGPRTHGWGERCGCTAATLEGHPAHLAGWQGTKV